MSKMWKALAIAVLLTFGGSGVFAQATSQKTTKPPAKTTPTQTTATPQTQAQAVKETKKETKAKKKKSKKAKKAPSESTATKKPQ